MSIAFLLSASVSPLAVIIHGDFYKAVKAAPLRSYHFLQMPCADSPNGGLWYVQNAHPRGPVVRMLEEAVRMGLLVLRLRKRINFRATGGKDELAWMCSWTDQDVIECVASSISHLSRARSLLSLPLRSCSVATPPRLFRAPATPFFSDLLLPCVITSQGHDRRRVAQRQPPRLVVHQGRLRRLGGVGRHLRHLPGPAAATLRHPAQQGRQADTMGVSGGQGGEGGVERRRAEGQRPRRARRVGALFPFVSKSPFRSWVSSEAS